MYDINRKAGIVNRGNEERLRNVMKRAAAGESLTIGFIGGSITQGSLASTPKRCYAYRVFSWWKDAFPMAEFAYVNAGIGATTSQYGAARVEKDLLSRQPDVVFIEFSVNDESDEHYLETYEGLVRKTLLASSAPAVILIHNVCYNNGASAELMHRKIGRHYDLSCISMQSSVYPELLSGRISNREITPDDLHPNDAGHELVASVISYYLGMVRDEAAKAGNASFAAWNRISVSGSMEEDIERKRTDGESEAGFPLPLTANTYEHSVRYDNTNYTTPADGNEWKAGQKDRREENCMVGTALFTPDLRPKEGITDIFKNGWEASAKNAQIEFEVEGRGISVQFRRSVAQPAPVAEVIVDGDPATRLILDANFDETWGDKMELLTVTEHMPKGRHQVMIRLVETHENDVVPFYLNAVIAAN